LSKKEMKLVAGNSSILAGEVDQMAAPMGTS
jgi:hypothetical protein